MRLGQQAGKALRTRATNRPLSVCQACQQSRFFAVRSALRSTSQEAAATAAAAGNEASSSAQALLKTWDSLYPDNVRWKARLTEAMENREPGSPAKRFTRIAVLGTRSSGSEALVSALVQDPLHPDFLVAERWAHRPRQSDSQSDQPLLLSPNAGTVSNGISTPSPWLANNHLEILEFRPDTTFPLSESLRTSLLSADQLVLIVSDADMPDHCASLIEAFQDHPSLVVVCNTLLAADVSSFKDKVSNTALKTFVPFDSRAAQSALRSVGPASEGSDSGVDLALYSHNLTESRLPSIADAIVESRLASGDQPSAAADVYTLSQTSRQLQEAVGLDQQLAASLQQQRHFADSQLNDIFGEDDLSNPLSSRSTQEARKEASRAAFQYALQKRLSWWKLPFGRADDVMDELGQAAQVAWRRSESDVLFLAGRLDGLRRLVETRTGRVAAAAHSELPAGLRLHRLVVLTNEAQQLVESGKTAVTRESALEPFEQRRRQVMGAGGLAEAAHRSTQSVVLSHYLLLVGTSAASYLSVLSELAQWPTAATGGLFGLVFAGWRLQSGWEKVKRRFMGNLDRVQDGLEEDVRVFKRQAAEKTKLKLELLARGVEAAEEQRRAEVAQALTAIDVRKRALERSHRA